MKKLTMAVKLKEIKNSIALCNKMYKLTGENKYKVASEKLTVNYNSIIDLVNVN